MVCQVEADSPLYRVLRFEYLLLRTFERFIAFGEFDTFRREQECDHIFFKEMINQSAVGNLLPFCQCSRTSRRLSAKLSLRLGFLSRACDRSTTLATFFKRPSLMDAT